MDGVRPGLRATATIALLVIAAGIGLLVAGAGSGGSARATAPGLRADLLPADLDGAAAPAIRLRDARGGVLDSRTLAGHPYLVTFVYTRCPDLCPVIGSEIAGALRDLGPRANAVTVLAVSVDPRHDDPAAARRWLRERGLGGRQAHYLLGTRAQLTPVWRSWFVVAPGATLTDPTAHAAGVWLVDARGRLRGRWSGGESIAPGDIAHDLRALLA